MLMMLKVLLKISSPIGEFFALFVSCFTDLQWADEPFFGESEDTDAEVVVLKQSDPFSRLIFWTISLQSFSEKVLEECFQMYQLA